MPIFYSSTSVLVTDRLFKVTGTPERVFAIDQIQHVYMVRTFVRLSRDRSLIKLWPVGVAVAISAVVAAIEISVRGGSPHLISALALVICGVAMLVSPLRSLPVNELWAMINGQHRCLCREADDRTFGQIRRALVRAREHGARRDQDQ